jgi:hypothetical protein
VIPRIMLIHWNEAEAKERIARLRKAGFAAEACWESGGSERFKGIRRNPPDVLLIDLGRLPSHGRAVGVYFRQAKATRGVPLVFVDGAAEKVAAIRAQLPDAVYTDWKGAAAAIRRALRAPRGPVVVPPTMDAYAHSPLPGKLGIKAGVRVCLVRPPAGFERRLAELIAEQLGDEADTVELETALPDAVAADIVIAFAKSRAELAARLARAMELRCDAGRIWICWPKQTAKLALDLTQNDVRAAGLAAGLVDYKICAIDETWSGLCFSLRSGAGRGRARGQSSSKPKKRSSGLSSPSPSK